MELVYCTIKIILDILKNYNYYNLIRIRYKNYI